MNETSQSLVLRWARWQTRVLVSVWPEESRDWGEAIASEAEEIEQPLQALSWALGGVTVYLRAMGGHLWEWLKMPVGQRDGAAPLAGAPGPRRSRLFTALVLACAAGLLCLPEGREAIRTVRASWQDYAEIGPSQGELEKLAARAKKENDAQTMAFVALSTDDEKQATELADRAVKLEPRLFWIYEARSFWPTDSAVAKDWIAKAEAADPQNAVPYLRAARMMVERTYAELGKQHSPTEPEVNQALVSNPEWGKLMDKIFRAPIYNSFSREHEELNREVWRRNPQLLIGTVLPGLLRHAIPDVRALEWYAKELVKQAEQRRVAGQLEKAQDLLKEAQGLGERMEEDAKREGWFQGMGLSLERESTLGWKEFYEGTGQTAKAQEARQRAAQIEERGAALVQDAERRWRERPRLERNGWVVQLSGLAMILGVLAAGLGVGLFEIWPAIGKRVPRARRALSLLTDFAPGLFLAASAVFMWGFLPYERLIAAFREGSSGTGEVMRLSSAFWSLQDVTWRIGGADAAVLGWTLLTVVLSLLVALIMGRMAYRAMHRTAPQA